VAFGALLWRVNGLAFGAPTGAMEPVKASYLPMFVHLALVLGAGLYLPPALVAWFQHVAKLLG
jgi:hydrogenase-4 component F